MTSYWYVRASWYRWLERWFGWVLAICCFQRASFEVFNKFENLKHSRFGHLISMLSYKCLICTIFVHPSRSSCVLSVLDDEKSFFFEFASSKKKESALINNHPIYIFFLFKRVSRFFSFFFSSWKIVHAHKFIWVNWFRRFTAEGCVNPLKSLGFFNFCLAFPRRSPSLLNFNKKRTSCVAWCCCYLNVSDNPIYCLTLLSIKLSIILKYVSRYWLFGSFGFL